ncbi:MmgE/PrpD family protein [Paraferrimonas sp. SM1919]|uniref:MmgE/PrpD family protein n=1 Tax=Paraferrimonas sp. SM1919 TaxID=2662263 RepID=UPI0013D6A5C5|nr:MmgE/PrpD family protein [Paraferrimonas sp. SM1919]
MMIFAMLLKEKIMTARLAQLVQYCETKTIKATDRQRAYLHLLDWLACVAVAADSEPARAFGGILTDDGDSYAIAKGNYALAQATLYNGALGNILEMDDIHRSSILHPGPVIIASAFSLAMAKKHSLQSLLEAIVYGYEITIRVGMAIGVSHYQKYHNTSTCGVLGAAAACGKLLDLDQQQLLSAIANAASSTGGLWQMRHENVMTKQWHNAQAALNGQLCAQLAKTGVTGVSTILEGPQGLFAATSSDSQIENILAIDSNWKLHDCSFKPWPSCRHCHPAIDAFMQLHHHHYDFDRIEVETYQDALTFCDRPIVTTTFEAKFSIQYCLAALMTWGELKLQHFESAMIESKQLQPLMNSISIRLGKSQQARYPQHYGAKISLYKQQHVIAQLDIVDTLGDPQKPMTMTQIQHKVGHLTAAAGWQGIKPLVDFDLNETVTTWVELINQISTRK